MASAFRPSDLEGLAQKIIIQKVPDRKFLNGTLVAKEPIQFGQRTYTYPYMTVAGRAVVTAWGGAVDVSGTDVFVDERRVSIKPLQQGWYIHQHDIDAAKFANRDLKAARMEMAVQLVMDGIDQIGYEGAEGAEIYGLCNQPNANIVNLPAVGVGNGISFASKSANQIVEDLEELLFTVPSLTDGTYLTPTILLPTPAYIAAVRTKDAAADNESALTIFRKNARQYYSDVDVIQVPYLDTCGPGGTSTAICYSNKKENIEYLRTGIRKSPVEKGLNTYTGVLDVSLAGLALKQPISFVQAFGV